MSETNTNRGRVTIPTDVDVVPETLELLGRWGADAIRDCDGTDYPEELKKVDAKVYSTYYTTRKRVNTHKHGIELAPLHRCHLEYHRHAVCQGKNNTGASVP